MWLADQIQALFEEALRELDRLMRLELERVGPDILRWLDDLWARMPCDTCVEEFDRIVANLARDQLYVEEASRQAFIAWLNEANEAAKREVPRASASRLEAGAPAKDQEPSEDEPVLEPLPEGYLLPEVAKLLREALAAIEKLSPDQWLEEVRKLLDHLDLPPQVKSQIIEFYTALDKRWRETWGLLHKRGPTGSDPALPETNAPVQRETNQELLLRIAAGLDKLIAEGRLDELTDAMRELVRRIPELTPPGMLVGEFGKLVGELQEILNRFLDLLEALPPDAGEVAIELLQLALDIAGMFPGPGDVVDLLSALISARRGEWLDAILSVGSGIFLVGIALGVAKIGKRLKKLASLIAKLKGPAREILSVLVEGIAKSVKEIPLTSAHAAIEGLKNFAKCLRNLLIEAIEKLKRSKLLKKLQEQGVKHSPDRIVRIGRNQNGKIKFLEEGNAKSSWPHAHSQSPRRRLRGTRNTN